MAFLDFVPVYLASSCAELSSSPYALAKITEYWVIESSTPIFMNSYGRYAHLAPMGGTAKASLHVPLQKTVKPTWHNLTRARTGICRSMLIAGTHRLYIRVYPHADQHFESSCDGANHQMSRDRGLRWLADS